LDQPRVEDRVAPEAVAELDKFDEAIGRLCFKRGEK
jgi:hypothetical protein